MDDKEYEQLRGLNSVDGTGVDPAQIRVHRKRLKNAHRKSNSGLSFKEFCRKTIPVLSPYYMGEEMSVHTRNYLQRKKGRKANK